MRVVVGKIEGVQSVKVSLKEGMATIQLAPSNRVTVDKIRAAIRSNGFTAREAEVRVAGSLVQRGDTLTLVVPGTGELFVLHNAPGPADAITDLRRRGPGTRVVIAGQISNPGPRRGGRPMRLLVRAISAT